jgi:hypothetical protein
LGLGIRPTVWYFFVFSLFLLGWKYHTVGLVPNSIRNKLKAKKYHTVGLVPNPNKNKLKTKKYQELGKQCGISLFLVYFYWD